jgi:hypothetical protein
MKLLQLQNQAADVQTKSAFALQLDFLLAEAWPLRHSATVSPPPLASQWPVPLLTPAATSFGSYAPSNSISMGILSRFYANCKHHHAYARAHKKSRAVLYASSSESGRGKMLSPLIFLK